MSVTNTAVTDLEIDVASVPKPYQRGGACQPRTKPNASRRAARRQQVAAIAGKRLAGAVR